MGQRRGEQGAVVGPEPVHPGHHPGLVQQRPMGVQGKLRGAGRARRRQGDGQVRRPGGGPPTDGRSDRERVARTEERRRLHPRRDRPDVRRAGQMVHGHGDRAQPPAGPEQRHRVGPVRQLPSDGVAPVDPEVAQPTRQRGDPGLDGAVAAEGVVERVLAPRSAGRRPLRREGVVVGGGELFRHEC